MKFFWILLICLILPQSFAHGDNIYVAPIKGSNDIPKEKLDTLRELIKIHIQEFPNHKVVNSLEKADFYLQTKLIKFEKYTLSMSRWKGRDKVISGQWKANSLGELESSSEQAVRHMVSTEESKGAILVDDKKSLGEQAKEKNSKHSLERVTATSQVLLGFGPGFFSDMNSPDTSLAFQAGYFWNINDNVDIGLQTDLATSTVHSEASMFLGKIVGNYFFTVDDISPYAGAGFGYGWAKAYDGNSPLDDDTSGGFALSLQAGAKFFRTSTVNLGIGAEYTKILNENSLGAPSLFLIRVGLYY